MRTNVCMRMGVRACVRACVRAWGGGGIERGGRAWGGRGRAVAYHVQQMGAVGVVYVNRDDKLYSFIPYAVPVNITIPFFNVMSGYGRALIAKLANQVPPPPHPHRRRRAGPGQPGPALRGRRNGRLILRAGRGASLLGRAGSGWPDSVP